MVQSRILQQMVETISRNTDPADADSVLRAIDRFAIDSGAAFMHIGAEKGELVDEVVRKKAPRRVLELGTFFGYSAIRIARLLDSQASVTTLEVNPRDAKIARSLFEHVELDDRIQLIEGDASQSIKNLQEQFDLVFFDHYAGNYFKDLMLIEQQQLLQSGSYLVADNVFIHEFDCEKYLNRVRSDGLYRSETRTVYCEHHGGTPDAVEISEKI